MDSKTYESVCINSRLPNGTLFQIPFIFEIPKNKKEDGLVNLTRKDMISIWDPNRRIEFKANGGETDHPEVYRINNLDVLYVGNLRPFNQSIVRIF